MKITKIGHCCLLIETRGKRLLTDPGCFTIETHSTLKNIDAILFTHEHADHFHLDSLQVLLEKHPDVIVFVNTSVAELLTQESIAHTVIHDGETVDFEGILLTGYGIHHAKMHSSIPYSANTGYMIDQTLFYPGDAFILPHTFVDILALPVSGPWMKVSEAIDYALQIKPKIAFPVHDHIRFVSSHMVPSKILPEHGIEFVAMVEGESREF